MVFAGDLSDERVAVLRKTAQPLADKNKLSLRTYNPAKDKLRDRLTTSS